MWLDGQRFPRMVEWMAKGLMIIRHHHHHNESNRVQNENHEQVELNAPF